MTGPAGRALLALAITPKTDADQERLAHGVRTLTAEDPSMTATTDPATGEVVIGAMGELHLEVIVDRLKREFNVEARLGRPQVAYKETLTRPADGEMKYARHTDGRSEYAHAKIHVRPGRPGSGYVFENESIAGVIPKAFITSIDEGIQEAIMHGVLAGYPVDDVRVVLYDGSYHDLDSSEHAFKIAGSMAFDHAARNAKPVLLEPMMRIEVSVPGEHTADVIDNLASRRGHIESQQERDGWHVIGALAPLAGMFGYTTDLRSRTRERGTFAMQFAWYQPCEPPERRDGDGSMVGAPRRPLPTRPASSVALPEPIGDDRRE